MNHAKPLLMSVGAAYQRHPARMFLRPEQHSHIAAAYDKAAFDVSLPAHTRAAFAKAAWFRLLACIDEKLERGALNPSVAKPKGLGATADPFGFIAG